LIVRVATRPPLRLCTVVLFTLGTGIALSLLSRLALPDPRGWTVAATQLASLGGALIGLAILATAIIFVWTLLAALIDRL